MNRTPRLGKSSIEYLDYVWNFMSGCTKGCDYCWARKRVRRFPQHYPNGFEPTLYPEAFTSPWHLKKPSIIGVAFMGDLFDDAIDPAVLAATVPGKFPLRYSLKARIFLTIQQAPQHKFLFLTKQPQELAKWSPFPDNCWVGVSATHDGDFGTAESYLARIEAKVKYISVEPLLERMVGISPQVLRDAGINWLIIGAQTKPYIAPKIEWIEEIVEAADKAGIPVFLKNSLFPLLKTRILENLWWADYRDDSGHEHLHCDLRQEMPSA